MEKYQTVKLLLDALFGTKDLTSWTLHENGRGSICTLRFGDTISCDSDTPMTANTFKRKSKSQIDRDRKRMNNFNHNLRPNTRSATHAEDARSGDSDSISHSATGFDYVSAVDSDSDPDPGDSFQLDGHSPSMPSRPEHSSISTPTRADSKCRESEPILPVTPPDIDIPTGVILDSERGGNTKRAITFPRAAELFTADENLILTHLSDNPECTFRRIECDKCSINIRMVGVRPGQIRLSYCEMCKLYFCSNRTRPPYCTGYEEHKSLCQHPLLFIT